MLILKTFVDGIRSKVLHNKLNSGFSVKHLNIVLHNSKLFT